jgi:hypothetical protein
MRAAEADILLVPGLGDSGPEHWQSRWATKLSTASRVTQRDWAHPVCVEWTDTVIRAVGACARPVVIVAHSLGVIATLHAAQRVGSVIAGAFLVAPPSADVIREHPAIDPAFLPVPRSRLPFPAVIVGSTDDPYADAAFAPELARNTGAHFIDAGAAGHINVDSGHGPWPEGSLAFAHFIAKL